MTQVERSDDRGERWKAVGAPLPCMVTDLDVHPKDPARIYASCGGYSGHIQVYDGQTWTARKEANGLERDYLGRMVFERIAVDPSFPNVIYAGQRDWAGPARGIARSIDSGASWETINWNLPVDLDVWGISVSPHDSTVWIATDYGNFRMMPAR